MLLQWARPCGKIMMTTTTCKAHAFLQRLLGRDTLRQMHKWKITLDRSSMKEMKKRKEQNKAKWHLEFTQMFSECCSTEAPNSITSHGTRHISYWLGLPLFYFHLIEMKWCKSPAQCMNALEKRCENYSSQHEPLKHTLVKFGLSDPRLNVLVPMLPTLPQHSNITAPEWRQPVNNAP